MTMTPMDDAIRLARVPRRLAARAPRLRQGLERWLAGCQPARHGLPAEAIVLVRRLGTGWRELVHPAELERYASLAALLAGARRAATADADAEVVWFADEAELLACMARDALSGALHTRWWWQALKPSMPGGASPVLARWLQAPRLLPRAVQRLGSARAAAFLASLDAREKTRLLATLGQAWAMAPEVRAWVLDEPVQAGAVEAWQDLTRHPSLSDSPSSGLASAAPERRGERLLRLLGMLAEDPAAGSSLARLAAAASPPTLAPRVSKPRASAVPASDAPRKNRLASSPLHAAAPVVMDDDVQPPLPAQRMPTTKPQALPAGTVPSLRPRGLSPATLTEAAEEAARTQPPAQWTDASPSPVAPLADAPSPASFATRHGGLLFLLNAALQLSFYGDFTAPLQRGLDCSPWRFLALAGRAWCGGPGWRRDPLWAWLKRRAPAPQAPCPLHIWPLLHARLLLALDDGQAELKPRQRLRAMLDLPARVLDKGERVDMFFSLAELPLAVRLAGLDRDPGWIPAAGCDVHFHFD